MVKQLGDAEGLVVSSDDTFTEREPLTQHETCTDHGEAMAQGEAPHAPQSPRQGQIGCEAPRH